MSGVELLSEIEQLLKPLKINGTGVNFGYNNAISKKEIDESEILEIEDYKGFNVKVIIKKNEK